MTEIVVLGAGLAGAEAAWQLASFALPVRLIDMKPTRKSPAHHSPYFAELVCSNSLRSRKISNAAGLLKQELRMLNSLVMEAADACELPAGGALAVDREAFPRYIDARLRAHPLIRIEEREIQTLTELGDGYRLIASGPLTGGDFYRSLEAYLGQGMLSFFDAAAPLVEADSLNREIIFAASRYEAGAGDYLNCPLTEAEYKAFHHALLTARRAEIKDFEKRLLFPGCQPVENLAEDGLDTLRFGPMKPVGLPCPTDGKEAHAIVQLRQDDFSGGLWNMVGFQTRLAFPEQERVFRMIPGLENLRFARYGVMHRNSFVKGPAVLGAGYRSLADPRLFIIGQLSGVEGYLESCSSGLVAARLLAEELGAERRSASWFHRRSCVGALAHYISAGNPDQFQPMKANFSLFEALSKEELKSYKNKYALSERGRELRRLCYSLRSLEAFRLSEEKIREVLAHA